MSYFTTLGSPLYERFDNHETKKKCFIKSYDKNGKEKMYNISGDLCNQMSNNIKVHLCKETDFKIHGKCYQNKKNVLCKRKFNRRIAQ